MFGNKRLAKRSIVGTRVGAMWPQDGRYYPGMIHSQISEQTVTSSAVYLVRFDDGFDQQIKSRNIVGPGFQSITSVFLKRGQKIYLTLNGREVSGIVLSHDRDSDEVLVSVRTPFGEDFETVRRLEEVRLLESRKSARLVDQPDTDYSKLADLQLSEVNKKRVTSHVIDVPSLSADKNDRYRRMRHESEEMPEHGEAVGDFADVEMMDETIAAMVLTSLSVSPKSPPMGTAPQQQQQQQQQHFTTRELAPDSQTPYPDSHLSSSVASSGFYSGHSERDDPSPPLPPLSESAPASVGYKSTTPLSDDDSSDSGRLLICEEEEEEEENGRAQVLYTCTWRGCDVSTNTRDAVERHIRRAHFDRDSDLEMTDNEEDFHYTEVDVTSRSISKMTQSFAALHTSSPSDEQRSRHRHRHKSDEPSSGSVGAEGVSRSFGGSGGVFDHDYQRKISKQNQASSVPSGKSGGHPAQGQGHSASLPISISDGQIKRSLSWQIHSSSPGALVSPPIRPTKLTPQERLVQHQAQSPKSHFPPSNFKVTQHRRPRSEVRKCRKVYGMEHRDQWCTQCKWKKACTRFID